jgi:hypothetical protein
VSPFSAPVLVGAALVSSPALWNVIQGTTPAEVALTRYLVSVVLCWMALAVLAMLIGPVPPAEPVTPTDAAADADAPTEQLPVA